MLDPDGYTGKCYQTFKEKDQQFYTKSFRQASITLIPKPIRDITRKKKQSNIPLEYRQKKTQSENLTNKIQCYIRTIHIMVM